MPKIIKMTPQIMQRIIKEETEKFLDEQREIRIKQEITKIEEEKRYYLKKVVELEEKKKKLLKDSEEIQNARTETDNS